MSTATTIDRLPGRPRPPVPAHLALHGPVSPRRHEPGHRHRQPDDRPRRPPCAALGGFLLEATCCSRDVTIGHATCGEVASLPAGKAPGRPRDVLKFWSLLAIRDPEGCGTRIMALGWRVHLMRAWLSPPVVAVDVVRGVVRTETGQSYRLLEPDGAHLEPRLRLHLVRELDRRGWPMSGAEAVCRRGILREGERVGRFLLLRDREGCMHAVAATAVGAMCEVEDGTLLMLPAARALIVPRALRTVLAWFDGQGPELLRDGG